jgi:hypothetical protein|tara:strand:+ start:77 stop:571 length:495 start_codon:yes stop_codon:yes gene_type:complete
MAEPIFLAPYFLDYVLPFVLVFTLIFAILQKTQLLGEDKRQVDALIGLVVGMMLIAFPGPRSIIVLLMPFLAVAAVILLVFMMLYGFISGKSDGDVLGKNWKKVLIGVLTVALVVFLLTVTGYWDNVWYYFGGDSSFYWVNGLFLAIVVGAIFWVMRDGASSSS